MNNIVHLGTMQYSAVQHCFIPSTAPHWWHFLMAEVPPSRTVHSATLQNQIRNGPKMWKRDQGIDWTHLFPRSNPIKHQWDVLEEIRSKDATPMPRAPPEVLFSSLNGSEPCLIYSEKSTNLEDLLQQVLWLLMGSISGKFWCHFNNINAYWANPEECCSVHCPAEGPLPSESVVDVLDVQQCLGGWLSS